MTAPTDAEKFRVEKRVVIDAAQLTPRALADIELILRLNRSPKSLASMPDFELFERLEGLRASASETMGEADEVMKVLRDRRSFLATNFTESVAEVLAVSLVALEERPELVERTNALLERLGKSTRITEDEIKRAQGVVGFIRHTLLRPA